MAQERTSARRCVRLASMKNGAGRAGEQKVSVRPWSLDSEQRREASRGMSRLGQTIYSRTMRCERNGQLSAVATIKGKKLLH